ncbi:pyrroline-5-carboxylate reductase [Bacillus sp. 31A1R]|uniref:Pyrroline-5-carboxylate reductase n=1 Tax=Robertmurraya mangrovi TaxID=3098077 RepID=A0ABU5J3J7_9BACI|nr:pyrroline-5-carboxylate reductase [Bacillus sp. 31A1R]MDZ5473982.1 pyrroline-5-carboxylate reductase [Bacillus sp. 31A1R]
MNKNIGFIGCGKMAKAMIEGIIGSGNINADQIKVSTKTENSLQTIEELFPIHTALENKEVASWADYLVLAIKPDQHQEVIKEIKDSLSYTTVIITIAAGITLEALENLFGRKIKAVRTMPNTPSLVREGMSAVTYNPYVSTEEREDLITIFNCFGKVEEVEEGLMDSIPAISGSSPAYVYMFIEALADGGVKQGIARDQAYKLAAQAVLGAAKMVLETGIHPGELKDQVCTPGGATIEAVATLEEKGLRSAVLSAMESCTNKVQSLSQK